ncbi:hypothetical protein FXF51_06200 [Nonomuraea sp. PA05]|uniref:hypothetical protein n=1 Tax=Nonomuraea sp. PA05 TaxID=2604466 RepID=UPI0011D35865|nr:hypothetical protein [Nonomuraea sp. PA05]TYB69752.1 hypothetical protein FXF51_06200 [Nonomuraea sp. PA05]
MTAGVRSVKVTHINGGNGEAARGAASPGDVLVAFMSADSGGNFAMSLGGAWIFGGSMPGGVWPGSNSGTWAGTKIYTKVCEAGEPATYQAFGGAVADTMVTIVAVAAAQTDNVVIQLGANGSSFAPGATPAEASGLQLRYMAGVPSPPGASVSWSVPAGFTELVDEQGDFFTSVMVASAPVVSSLDVPFVTFSSSPSLAAVHGITVLIASTTPPVPDPPVVQPYAPGKGSSQYRYVVTDLRSRQYMGDLELENVSFDKRILQAGSFSATIPIPSRRVGDQIAEIIPRDETYLDRGPGVITVQIFREGEPWGEYWITSAQPSRSRRGTPEIQLRGSTLEAYLSRVEIQSDLFYTGTDQVEIARSLLSDLMSDDHAGIGLNLQSGNSGVARDRVYLDTEGGTYGQRLIELAQVDDGFEWMINFELVDGSLVRNWVWGYPRLGVQDPPPHLFADGRSGGDILEWSEEIDALRGATRWRARGSSSSGDASVAATPLISAVHEATAHLEAGWPRLDKTLSYSTVTEQATLDDYAAFWAQRAAGALRVDQVTVTFGKNPSLTPNNLGDAARLYFNNEWHLPHWRTRRVIGIGITPTSRASGKEEARLVLEGQEAPT